MATNIMRCVVLMALSPLLSAVSVDSTKAVQLQTATVDVNFISPFHPFSKEARRERRKERRILRKKKQRLRELREEIRILTHSLQQTRQCQSTCCTSAVDEKTVLKFGI
ncbi:hypothetical protein GCK32_008260 [Trichostrongylus colubriformis]|uniref:Uncharacterized protein n=1 Tax=Trichostrongylus colubriformis TaxID=6319 RepID=A0AAN8FXU9_TRICO